jgi:hypothetical protein
MAGSFITSFLVVLDGALAWALAALLLRGAGARRLVLPYAASLAGGLSLGAALLFAARARGLALGEVAPQLLRVLHLHGFALLAGALAARNLTSARLAGAPRLRGLAEAALLASGLLFLLPQGTLLASALRDDVVLLGAAWPVLLSAAAGIALAAALGALLAWAWGRAGLGRAVTPSSFLALLFALALAGIGPTALGAHTLPAALSGAIGRALHDGVHLAFVTFQVPDHPFLRLGAYQAILFAFEPSTHALAAIVGLGLPLVLALAAFLRRPAPAVAPDTRPPERRRARAAFLRESRLGGTAFVLAAIVLVAAIHAEGARADALYDPLPEPAVDDGAGQVIVPLASPLGGGDDRMRKFVYTADGRAVTFFVVRRGDGVLTAALDLCDICQPKGYAQLGRDYVFCKYCKTPIPVGTVGQPGGCNPIPIPAAQVKGSLLVIPRDALVATWEKGMADKR